MKFNRLIVLLLLSLAFAGCSAAPQAGISPETAWNVRHGIVAPRIDQLRAQRLCMRLCTAVNNCPLQVTVLENPRIRAWSWPDGHIYLTTGLVSSANNAELAAAMAHEMGHLVNNRNIPTPAGLARGEELIGIESAADMTACRILRDCGIPPAALIQLLTLVRSRSRNHALQYALTRRIHVLQRRLAKASHGIVSRRPSRAPHAGG